MKILSLTQHWIKEQRDRSLEHATSCKFPNHAQYEKLLANIFLKMTLKHILCDHTELQAPTASGQYCNY